MSLDGRWRARFGAPLAMLALACGSTVVVSDPFEESNESLVCEPGSLRSCYGGPVGTENVGVCRAGSQICHEDGNGYEACTGEVLPSAETCLDPADHDCDGEAAACTGEPWWSARHASLTGYAKARAVAVAGDGDVIVAGQAAGDLDLGDGISVGESTEGHDIYLIRYQADGSIVHAHYASQITRTEVDVFGEAIRARREPRRQCGGRQNRAVMRSQDAVNASILGHGRTMASAACRGGRSRRGRHSQADGGSTRTRPITRNWYVPKGKRTSRSPRRRASKASR